MFQGEPGGPPGERALGRRKPCSGSHCPCAETSLLLPPARGLPCHPGPRPLPPSGPSQRASPSLCWVSTPLTCCTLPAAGPALCWSLPRRLSGTLRVNPMSSRDVRPLRLWAAPLFGVFSLDLESVTSIGGNLSHFSSFSGQQNLLVALLFASSVPKGSGGTRLTGPSPEMEGPPVPQLFLLRGRHQDAVLPLLPSLPGPEALARAPDPRCFPNSAHAG